MRFNRTLGVGELERGSVDTETGEFPVTLFTDGEASDGHVLDVAGARLAPRMPLFVNHFADPSAQLGSLFEPDRQAHRIRYRAQIELGGPDSGMAEIRRDVLHMIAAGHVGSMSGRWDADAKDVVPRTQLPADHPAFVDSSKEQGRKRWGLFFKRWTALEGSVVGLGADPKALIGRALEAETPAPARAFWRDFAAAAEPKASAEPADLFAELRVLYLRARGQGAAFADVLNALDGILGSEDAGELERFAREGRELWLPRPVIAALAAEREAFEAARAALLELGQELRAAHVPAVLETLEDLDDATDPEPGPGARAAAPEPMQPTVAGVPADVFFGSLSKMIEAEVTRAVRSVTGRVQP